MDLASLSVPLAMAITVVGFFYCLMKGSIEERRLEVHKEIEIAKAKIQAGIYQEDEN